MIAYKNHAVRISKLLRLEDMVEIRKCGCCDLPKDLGNILQGLRRRILPLTLRILYVTKLFILHDGISDCREKLG